MPKPYKLRAKPGNAPAASKPRVSEKEALVRGEIWKRLSEGRRLSPQEMAKSLKQHGITPKYVTNVKRRLKRRGLALPTAWAFAPHPASPDAKTSQIRAKIWEMIAAGKEPRPGTIVRSLKWHGVKVTDVTSQLYNLRKQGLNIPKMPTVVPHITGKEALVRGEIWESIFRGTGFSTARIARTLEKHGIAPKYVAGVKRRLQRRGMLFPPNPTKVGLIIEQLKKGVRKPKQIEEKLMAHGITAHHASKVKYELRKKRMLPRKSKSAAEKPKAKGE